MMTLTVSTNQEAFDAAMAHLVKLAKRNQMPGDESGSPRCSYLGEKCAVGALIAEFEGKDEGSAHTLVQQHRLDPGNVSSYLLCDLQQLHDSPGNWAPDFGFVAFDEAEKVAKRHGLVYERPMLPTELVFV